MRAVLTLLLFAALSHSAFGQAFGVHMGMKIEEFSFAERSPLARSSWNVIPPEPNENFHNYKVLATEEHGVCSVSGFTSHAQTSSAEKAFHEVLGVLKSIYGEPSALDSNDFVFKKVPAPLSAIAIRLADTLVMVSYDFANVQLCLAKVREVDATGL